MRSIEELLDICPAVTVWCKYPHILGRPWLRHVGAIQNWKEGKKGKARQFDMQSRQELEEEFEETVIEEEESESSSDQVSSEEDNIISVGRT